MSSTFAPRNTLLATAATSRMSAFTAASAILVVGAAALVWVLASGVWSKQPEMSDRFLIPVAAVVLVAKPKPRWHGTAVRPRRAGLVLLAPAAAVFTAGWYLLVLVGPRTLLLWWLLGAWAMAMAGLLLARYGWLRTRLVLFPLFSCFLALPIPDVVQGSLQLRLKGLTTAGAAVVLPWLGVPAEMAGFTLRLPSGDLGVVDACSGASSLTALAAISLLTGYVRLTFFRDFTPIRAVALFTLTLPIVVASNVVRVIASGVLKEYVGDWAIRGAWHEALGYLVVLVGFGLIVGMSQRLTRRVPASEVPPSHSLTTPPAEIVPPFARGGAVALGMLVPALAACLWCEQFRQSHQLTVRLDELALCLPGWQGQAAMPEPDVAEMLKCDQLLLRRYEDDWGRCVDVYVMFWAVPAGTAHMHHPDICWPCRGWSLEEGHIQDVTYADGRAPLRMSVRHYERRGQHQVVYFWTQTGPTVLPDGPEPAGHSDYAWIGTLLRGQPPLAEGARLSVLLGADTPAGHRTGREPEMEKLAAEVAADLYRLCPWAAPDQ